MAKTLVTLASNQNVSSGTPFTSSWASLTDGVAEVELEITLTAGATAPTTVTIEVETSPDNGTRVHKRATNTYAGSSVLANNEARTWRVKLHKSVLYTRVKVFGNSAQAVTLDAHGVKFN